MFESFAGDVFDRGEVGLELGLNCARLVSALDDCIITILPGNRAIAYASDYILI